MATKSMQKGKPSGRDQREGHESRETRVEEPLDEQELESLYAWVDSIPLTRPKRNISRDFSDGVLVAELMHHYFPKIVELHNYTPANSSDKKRDNWLLLNRKVFSRLNFELDSEVINDLCSCKPGMIEKVLLMLQVKIKRAEYARGRQNDKPEADQHMSPGRKEGSKMIKVGMDDTKGSRFIKTKQLITGSRLGRTSPVKPKRLKEKAVEILPVKKVRFKDEMPDPANKSRIRVENFQRQRLKMPILETDVVPRIMLEEREQEILAKDEMTKILQAKISRLEHLLHLKDMRIDDLQGRIETMRPTGIRK